MPPTRTTLTLDNTQASTIISPYSRLESISREVFSSLIYAPAAHDSSCESLRQAFLAITPAKHHSHGPIIGRTFKSTHEMIATSADNRNPDANLSFRLPVQSSAPHGFKFPGADLVQSIMVLADFSTLIYALRYQDYRTTTTCSLFSREYKRYRKQLHDA